MTHPVAEILGSPLTWLAGVWGVFAGLVLALPTTFFAETGPGVVNVGAVLAIVLLPVLVWATARLAQSGWTGLATWSGWVIGTVALGSKTHTGSLLLLGDTNGSAVLYGGTLVGAIAVGVMGTRLRSPLKRPALPVAAVDDDDAEGEQGIAQPV